MPCVCPRAERGAMGEYIADPNAGSKEPAKAVYQARFAHSHPVTAAMFIVGGDVESLELENEEGGSDCCRRMLGLGMGFVFE